jgi:O-Antigen ligase
MIEGVLTQPYVTNRRIAPEASLLPMLQRNGALLVFLLCLVGYPLVGMLVTFAGLPSQVVTIPFRALVAGLSLAVIVSGLFTRLRGRLDVWLCLFLTLYLVRLLYDRSFAFIPGNDEALLFYLGTVLLPVTAACLGGAAHYTDSQIAKPLLLMTGLIVVLGLLAQVSGLGYNPWLELYGVRDIRLGFEAVNSITLGNAASTAALVGLYIAITSGNSVFWRASAIFTFGLGSYLMVQAGSRGALIGFVMAIIWYGASRLKRAAVLGPLLVPLLLFAAARFEFFEQTLAVLQGGWQTDASAQDRFNAQRVAIEDFWDAPIVGKHFINPALGAGEYPHNLVIETAMAMGVVGLTILFVIFMRALFVMFQQSNQSRPLLTALLVQYAIGTLLSGAIAGYAAFFLVLMMLLSHEVKLKR